MAEEFRLIARSVLLLTLAVTPAVCEEFFFRGYLFGALRQTMRPWKTIVFSAMLFGAFHVVTTNSLSVERFIPSTVMGLALGWICWRSGSGKWPEYYVDSLPAVVAVGPGRK